MKLCLTDEELRDLTDTAYATLQMEWLDANRWPYVMSRRGRPKVARALFEERMGIRVAAEGATGQTSPDWTADA